MHEFDRIIGYDSIKQELMQISDVLKNAEAYTLLGAKPPRGLLLYGRPGVGKSLMASALIEASGRKAFLCRKDKPDGEFINHIRTVFDTAKAEAPSIVFLDDMDKFANEDEQHPDAEEYVTVQSCIDDCKGSDIFVLATVNDMQCLPESLCRVGRFDRTIEVENPSGEDAEKIIAHYIAGKNFADGVSAGTIAGIMNGRSCAELETVINEAGLYAGYERSPEITMDHFMKAALHTVFDVPNEEIASFGLKKKRKADALQVAYHEAGHTVIGEILEPGSVTLVSAFSRNGDSGGFTQGRPMEDMRMMERMENRIVRTLGGAAASEQVFGSFDTGCSRDLDQAFEAVWNLVTDICCCGFHLHCNGYKDSAELRAKQEQAVSAEVEKYYRKAKEILAQNRNLLDGIARALMEKGVLTVEDIAAVKKACNENE
jgi:cell division protease FtsH